MSNYDNVRGVGYRRYEGDDQEPTVDTHEARLDELYEMNGRLEVSVDTPDGHISISIPVTAREDWGQFVESLPTWNEWE